MVEKSFLVGNGELCLDHSVRMLVPEDALSPGFYDLYFTVNSSETVKSEKKATFGYRIDEIPLTDSRPSDFEMFWRKALDKSDEIPLNSSETFIREMDDQEISKYNMEFASIPEDIYPAGKRCDKVKLYKVQFDSIGKRRIHGWLAVPNGKGPFPGMLVLPGAGCGKLPAPVEHARHGYVSLIIQIHGMDVDQEKYETPTDYLKAKSGAVEDEYYYNVYLACAQAMRYLVSRTDVDSAKLAAVGASQGGILAIVTAALRPQVKVAVSSLCYYGYWPLRDQIKYLNDKKQDGKDASSPPPFERKDARQNNLSYYDPANFAPMLRASTIMCACLSDGPSPSPTVHAVYRRLGDIRKELCWSPGTNHDFIILFERMAWQWVDKELQPLKND
jgi:cephalosporin-C deacetylase-like acetyl esterase